MAKFQIVTRDGDTYTGGQTHPVLGADRELVGYRHEGDFIVLEFGEAEVLVPEAAIRYIAELTQS